MLIYNPAFDFHHCVFRMLQILTAAPDEPMEVMKLQLLDFLLLFPEQLDQIRIPPELRKKRGMVNGEESPYRSLENPHRMFLELAPYQHQALNALAARELIDPHRLKEGGVLRTSLSIPPELATAIGLRNATTKHMVDLVSRNLASLPLFGKNGLRDRAKFLSSRYDAT